MAATSIPASWISSPSCTRVCVARSVTWHACESTYGLAWSSAPPYHNSLRHQREACSSELFPTKSTQWKRHGASGGLGIGGGSNGRGGASGGGLRGGSLGGDGAEGGGKKVYVMNRLQPQHANSGVTSTP